MSLHETYRPRLHFSPRTGWMNDPNGLIEIDGVYHLFFQHDPDSTLHRRMHWGHATSGDLVHWQERPVALHPDDLGTCFSGSAVETADGGIALFYTIHRRTEAGEDDQCQALAHADRALERFTRFPANPVLANPGLATPGLEVFRDPKVIWHAPTRRWIMLVSHGQSVGFYASRDLVEWTFLSTFGEIHGRHGRGPWECPDMVAMTGPSGETVWMLIVGVGSGAYGEGSGTQYFLGRFDGRRFRNANSPGTELWLDHGRDHYATQTFFAREARAPLAMSWASNVLYAQQTPTEAFRGVMTLPRELRLIETAQGLRAAASVPDAVSALIPQGIREGVGRLLTRQNLDVGGEARIALFGEADAHFVVRRTGERRGAIRTVRAPVPGMRGFAHDYAVELEWPAEGLDIELFVDRGLVELCAGGGLVWITTLHFPANPEGAVRIEASGAERVEHA